MNMIFYSEYAHVGLLIFAPSDRRRENDAERHRLPGLNPLSPLLRHVPPVPRDKRPYFG